MLSGALRSEPQKSIQRFMDQVRERTRRRVPPNTLELIANLNPVIRGWAIPYKRAPRPKALGRLNGWIVRLIRSHRCKRSRNIGWRQLPETKLYGEYGLVNLVQQVLDSIPEV
jgi:RNA-directed DNA polymerase